MSLLGQGNQRSFSGQETLEVRPEWWRRICPREELEGKFPTQRTANVRILPWNRSACERLTRCGGEGGGQDETGGPRGELDPAMPTGERVASLSSIQELHELGNNTL